MGVLVLLIVFVGLGLYAVRYHKTVSMLPDTNKTLRTASKAPNSQTATAPATDSQKSPSGGSTASSTSELKSPYGSFVSNHHPAYGDQEESICGSTPGATCYIRFTDGSTVKKLTPETVGAEGSTAWAWDTKILGSGSWKITAVASLNNQTKTTDDQITLEIPQ